MDYWVELVKARPSMVQLDHLNQADIEAKEQLQLHQSVQRIVFLYEEAPMDSSKWQRKQSSSGAKQDNQFVSFFSILLLLTIDYLMSQSLCVFNMYSMYCNYN